MPNMNIKKLWRRRSVDITGSEETYKVIYLGNVLTGWAKGEGCVEKPLATLWRNFCQNSRHDISMKVTICGSGLKAFTKEHGLTEYWAHRITYCTSHPAYPRVFCWIYRHEGRRLKQELRCHAVLCSKFDKAKIISTTLQEKLSLALQEFRREKIIRQNARLSVMNAVYDTSYFPLRKLYLVTGASNYRPPLERSKSAPKLGAIEELKEQEEEEELRMAAWALRRQQISSQQPELMAPICVSMSQRHPSDETIKKSHQHKVERPSDLYILSSLKDLSIRHQKEDSLTSDQPDSLSSESCSSSCKDSTEGNEDRMITEGISSLKGDLGEEDNISEESGYSEAKDCLPLAENAVDVM